MFFFVDRRLDLSVDLHMFFSMQTIHYDCHNDNIRMLAVCEQNWSKTENMNRWLGELQSRVTDAWNSQLSANIDFSPEHLRSMWIQLKRHSRAELNLTFELNMIDILMMSVECLIRRSSLHPRQRVNRPQYSCLACLFSTGNHRLFFILRVICWLDFFCKHESL